MTVVVFSPHQDDAELFCAYQVIRYQAYVVVCFRSILQELRGTGVTHAQRLKETELALGELGCHAWEQWEHPDNNPNPNPGAIVMEMIHLGLRLKPTIVYAPCVELGGHEDHNMVGDCAQAVFGSRTRPYMTYVRGKGRSEGETEVFPEAYEKDLKRAALDHHRTQIELENTRYWFSDESEWWREWLA